MADPRKNPAVAALYARDQLQRKAEAEEEAVARQGSKFAGREFLDVFTIRQVLVERDAKGTKPADIEKRLGLKPGVVARLGSTGVLGLVREQGREKKEVDVV